LHNTNLVGSLPHVRMSNMEGSLEMETEPCLFGR